MARYEGFGKRKQRPVPKTMSQGKPRKSTKRRCRSCGCDPWPNMFFCKVCFERVSGNDTTGPLSVDCKMASRCRRKKVGQIKVGGRRYAAGDRI